MTQSTASQESFLISEGEIVKVGNLLLDMGKSLNYSPPQWCAILLIITEKLQDTLNLHINEISEQELN